MRHVRSWSTDISSAAARQVEYQEMERQGAASHQQVNGSATYSALLASLRKFVTYEVRVLAYTRVGDGAASVPALTVRTFEDGETACGHRR